MRYFTVWFVSLAEVLYIVVFAQLNILSQILLFFLDMRVLRVQLKPWESGGGRPVWAKLDVTGSLRRLWWPAEYAGRYFRDPHRHQVFSHVDKEM